MYKKRSYIIFFLSMLFVFSCFVNYKMKVFADYNVKTNCKSSYLIEAESGKVIHSTNETAHLPIASMCKIMTLLIVFDKIKDEQLLLDENIIVSDNASGMGGSQIFLETGGEYSVDQLIKGIVVSSANDACVALAERICGSEKQFVDAMNERAKNLEMYDTNFVNCTGLPEEGQYSCSKDVAKMFSELVKHEIYFNYSKIWTDSIKHPKDRITEISNTNKLVKFYNGCKGGKTGYTKEAGFCLAAIAEKNNTNIIAVVIGAPDSKSRFNEVSNMFNYTFANYVTKTVIDKEKPLSFKSKVFGGKQDSLELFPAQSVKVFSEKNTKKAFEIEYEEKDNLKAPIKKGEVVGVLKVFENGVLINKVNVIAAHSIEKKNYYDNLRNCIDNWSLI